MMSSNETISSQRCHLRYSLDVRSSVLSIWRIGKLWKMENVAGPSAVFGRAENEDDSKSTNGKTQNDALNLSFALR